MSKSHQTPYGEKMIAEKDGAVGWMIFNNPERHNALSLDMWEAIPRILDLFEADAEIRVIVLKGAGEKSFISGRRHFRVRQETLKRRGGGAI